MPVKISGIVCPECKWRDDTVEFSEYPSYLNKVCSHCQYGILLTTEEYSQCLRIIQAVERYENFVEKMKWLNPINLIKRFKNK